MTFPGISSVYPALARLEPEGTERWRRQLWGELSDATWLAVRDEVHFLVSGSFTGPLVPCPDDEDLLATPEVEDAYVVELRDCSCAGP